MDDIADAAGVTKPLLYQHFASKRALYLELIDSVAQDMLDAINHATSAAIGPRQQVEAGFAAYFDVITSRADAFHLLFGSDVPNDPELSRALRHVQDVLALGIQGLITAGLDEDHRLLLAYSVVGMAEGACRHVLATRQRTPGGPVQPVDVERLAGRIADLAWAGLRQVHRDD
jgi:AcrR family transcriptional regulator